MKFQIFLLSVLALADMSHAIRAEPVESSLSAVTVYTDRAVVTRTAKVDVHSAGPIEVKFERLPERLQDESLRVAGIGTAKTSILDVTARASFVDFTPNQRVQALRDEIHGQQEEKRRLDDRIAALKKKEQSLDRVVLAETQPATASAPRLSLDEAAKLLLFIDEQRVKIADQHRLLDQQKEDLSAKQEAAERQLAEMRGAGGRGYKTVTVRLSAEAAGTIQLALSYAVPGAEWSPRYDARVASAEHVVQLGYFGVVRQNTGEDWKKVELTLSTARPSLGGAPPPLPEWRVDVVSPLSAAPNEFSSLTSEALTGSAFRARTLAAGGISRWAGKLNSDQIQGAGAAAGGPSAAPLPADYVQANPETQITSTSFKIPMAATVLSDNSPQRVPIATVRLAAESEYLAVPKLLQSAFLKSKVVNSSEFPLLAGDMNVFLDDTFVAVGALRTVMPGEKFDLALGADDGISVKRTLNRHFTEDIGLITKGKRITYDFTLTAQNNKKIAEKVVLEDQVPVSRNAKILVKLREPEEADAKPDSDGTLKWTFSLQPGEKREVRLDFSIEYPNEALVAGLE